MLSDPENLPLSLLSSYDGTVSCFFSSTDGVYEHLPIQFYSKVTEYGHIFLLQMHMLHTTQTNLQRTVVMWGVDPLINIANESKSSLNIVFHKQI